MFSIEIDGVAYDLESYSSRELMYDYSKQDGYYFYNN